VELVVDVLVAIKAEDEISSSYYLIYQWYSLLVAVVVDDVVDVLAKHIENIKLHKQFYTNEKQTYLSM
jgi:hypothetical protein